MMTVIYRLLLLFVVVATFRAVLVESKLQNKVAFALVLPPMLLRLFLLR